MSAELRDALNTPLQQSGLTFTVQAAPFRQSPKEASVALAIEIDGERLEFAPQDNGSVFANNIELSFFGINQDGRAQRATRTELNLTLRPETYKRVKANGLRANPRLVLEPGRYQLRVGARDSVARQVGTVFYDLQVPDFRKESVDVERRPDHRSVGAGRDDRTGRSGHARSCCRARPRAGVFLLQRHAVRFRGDL